MSDNHKSTKKIAKGKCRKKAPAIVDMNDNFAVFCSLRGRAKKKDIFACLKDMVSYNRKWF